MRKESDVLSSAPAGPGRGAAGCMDVHMLLDNECFCLLMGQKSEETRGLPESQGPILESSGLFLQDLAAWKVPVSRRDRAVTVFC